ncbi:hypothetical protein SLA2020_405410 [Shorea laevis]
MDQFRLPPLLSDKQRTVFLDLDNTRVYGCQHRRLCHQSQFSKKYDFKFKITNIEGQTKKYYASRVLDALDPKGSHIAPALHAFVQESGPGTRQGLVHDREGLRARL